MDLSICASKFLLDKTNPSVNIGKREAEKDDVILRQVAARDLATKLLSYEKFMESMEGAVGLLKLRFIADFDNFTKLNVEMAVGIWRHRIGRVLNINLIGF